MKLSVSLSPDDVAVLDAYVKSAGLPSRSTGLQKAIRLLRHPTLDDDYRNAWTEWSADESGWGQVIGDGFDDAAR